MMLPPYDTAATLARLTAVIARWRPRAIIALRQFLSRRGCAGNELAAHDLDKLSALQAGRDWIWIAGNRDPQIPARVGGERIGELRLGALTLRHEPAREAHGEIAGHLHPVAVIGGRRRAFVTDGSRVIAPAFGAYAGGLNLHNPAIARLFSGRRIAHVLGRNGVHAVCASRCAAGA